jgi:hypothetical protein
MSVKRSAPPWDFFHDASITSLQSFELSRLNHAANLRREIAALLDQWVSDNSEAMLARWIREHRSMARPMQADALGDRSAETVMNTIASPAGGSSGRPNRVLPQHPEPQPIPDLRPDPTRELASQSPLPFEPVPAAPRALVPRPSQHPIEVAGAPPQSVEPPQPRSSRASTHPRRPR